MPISRPLVLALALGLPPLAAACSIDDPCLDQATLHSRAPRGTATVTFYPGFCAGTGRVAQVALGGPSGRGVVLLSGDHGRLVSHVRWQAHDRLELVFRSAHPHAPVRRVLSIDGTPVTVVLRAVPYLKGDVAMLERARQRP